MFDSMTTLRVCACMCVCVRVAASLLILVEVERYHQRGSQGS